MKSELRSFPILAVIIGFVGWSSMLAPPASAHTRTFSAIDTLSASDSDSLEATDDSSEESDDVAEEDSHVIFTASYISHVAYRGRDNGITQEAFAPAVRYNDRSGVSVFGSVYWLSGGSTRWDQANIGGGYSFSPNEELDASISYSHFWFTDSSTLSRSLLDNCIDGTLKFDAGVFNLSTDLEVDFGTESEWNWSVAVAFPLSVEFVDFNPGAAALFGEQNQSLVLERIGRMKGHGPMKKDQIASNGSRSNIFGIMGYELTAPFSVSLGNFSVDPGLTYVVPVNVIDGSRTSPYLSAQIDLTLNVP